MPGRHITDCQKRLLMTLKKNHTVEIAAAKAGFSRATGYRLAADPVSVHQKTPRGRRRPDPPGYGGLRDTVFGGRKSKLPPPVCPRQAATARYGAPW